MKLRLQISSCPNDTFMFHALIHSLIDCQGLTFELKITDIEELNRSVINGNTDISKLSYAVVPEVIKRYAMLTSGSALGYGCGPLMVASGAVDSENFADQIVALPGEHTTANMLVSRIFPEITRKKFYTFNQIQSAVLSGECSMGVLIHEERFSFQDHGLQLVADLGYQWETRYKMPLPLGGIAVSRDIDPGTQHVINSLVRQSVEYAFQHPGESREYIKKYAQNLSDSVIDSHIAMFVNEFSLNLGRLGTQSVNKLLEGRLNGQKNIFIE